ncbi:MlaC/ttg2D family ABC transporter substrate-binding protein [Thiorhodococcus fuscus]|uniref:Phospholipid-binding protein MlaC n=1 Tax=Thiorhodococcus fuscus TaxID=527200 RepID=A0ABW4YDS4_9GAMM
MKASLMSFAVLSLGLSAGLAAQPYPYAPVPGAAPYGPAPMPYAPPTVAPWGAQAYPFETAPGLQDGGQSRSAAPGDGDGARSLPARPAGPVAEAGARLKEGMDRLLKFLGEQDSMNKLQVAAFLDREIAPYFDFDSMAQWVAGPAYRSMSPKERSDLTAWLESDFLSVLASNLVGYQGQQVRMLKPRHGPRGTVNINVAILRAGEYPSTLQFRMAPSDQGWRVYDVVANGRSAASYYRVQFQRMAGSVQGEPAVR